MTTDNTYNPFQAARRNVKVRKLVTVLDQEFSRLDIIDPDIKSQLARELQPVTWQRLERQAGVKPTSDDTRALVWATYWRQANG